MDLLHQQHDMVHFKASPNQHPLNISKIPKDVSYPETGDFIDRSVPHPIWTTAELEGVKSVSTRPLNA